MPVTPARVAFAPFTLSVQQARLLHLHAQGLLHKPAAVATPAALERAIARMQMLQIDTIHVVARSPYLTLFARVGAYPQAWLDDLLEQGRVAECWAHEASFVPSLDYPLHRACQAMRPQHWAQKHARRAYADHPRAMDELLVHVGQHGEVRAADFERAPAGAGGWWQWKPEKRWLEAWFAMGELMVARRERFQRVYDLRERVLAKHPCAVEKRYNAQNARREAIVRSVCALGIAQTCWIGDYFRLTRVTAAEVEALVASGQLLRVNVSGWDAPGFVCAQAVQTVQLASQGRLRATHTTLLSPFDPLVWDRARVQAMFDFEYRLECYVPAAKRKFGYFVLPILHRGRLIGRLDAKAHRAEGRFEVKALCMQPGVQPEAGSVRDVARAVASCAAWHGTPKVTFARTQPSVWRSLLRAQMPGL